MRLASITLLVAAAIGLVVTQFADVLTSEGQVAGNPESEQGQGSALEALDAHQHGEEAGVGGPSALGEDARPATTAGVLQAAAVAVDAHRHLGGVHLDVQLGEQTSQQRVGAVVVHDEAAVDVVRVTVLPAPVAGPLVHRTGCPPSPPTP